MAYFTEATSPRPSRQAGERSTYAFSRLDTPLEMGIENLENSEIFIEVF